MSELSTCIHQTDDYLSLVKIKPSHKHETERLGDTAVKFKKDLN